MSPSMRLLYKKVQGRKTLVNVTSSSTNSTQGVQAVQERQIFTRSQLDDIKTAALGGADNNDCKLYLGYSKHQLTLKNQSNHVVTLTLYDYCFQKQPIGSSLDTAKEVWDKGFTDMGLTTQSAQVGNTPFASPDFRRYIKVKRAIRISMEPGQQHIHTCYRRLNRLVSSTIWDGSAFTSVPYLTTGILFSFYGSIGHESATPTTVTYMPARVDWVVKEEYTYGFLPNPKPAYTYTNGLSTTVADFDHMGESGDADVNDMNA